MGSNCAHSGAKALKFLSADGPGGSSAPFKGRLGSSVATCLCTRAMPGPGLPRAAGRRCAVVGSDGGAGGLGRGRGAGDITEDVSPWGGCI